MRLLYVDSSRLARSATSQLLNRMGHEVVSVAGGQQALEATNSGAEFDIFIVSTNLARNNGMELIYEMRSYPDLLDIPAVVIIDSAISLDKDFSKALKALNIIACISKSQAELNGLQEVLRESTTNE